MIIVDMIQKAIAPPTRVGKARLKSAVATGKSDVTPADVKVDDRCEFGKWLRGPDFSAAEKETQNYRRAVNLHAKFHQEAARVVEWATSGHKDEAEKAMSLQGSYTKASSALIKELVEWRLTLN
ncbi:MAG: CZB domain-containing protein [Bryobacteraceae bacterium]|jgi:methyl-accepting chemotaxis protein